MRTLIQGESLTQSEELERKCGIRTNRTSADRRATNSRTMTVNIFPEQETAAANTESEVQIAPATTFRSGHKGKRGHLCAAAEKEDTGGGGGSSLEQSG